MLQFIQRPITEAEIEQFRAQGFFTYQLLAGASLRIVQDEADRLSGYSGWTQMQDGRVVIVDYTNGYPAARIPFARAYVTDEMFLTNASIGQAK